MKKGDLYGLFFIGVAFVLNVAIAIKLISL